MSSLHPIQQKKIDTFLEAMTYFLPHHYKPDCCIAATRITCNILGRLHFKVRPLCVTVTVFNPLMLSKGRMPVDTEEGIRWRDEGALMQILGTRDLKQEGKWPGHLVAIVYDKCLIDPTLPQLNRPAKGIEMPALSLDVSPDFLAAKKAERLELNGCLLFYDAFPEDKTFGALRDWSDKNRHRVFERKIWERMRLKLGKLL